MLDKIKYLIKGKKNPSDCYDDKYRKIIINSDDDSPLEKNLAETRWIDRPVCNYKNIYYPQLLMNHK